MKDDISKNQSNRASAFVNFVIDRMNQDKAIAAKWRCADNPATEYQSWEELAKWDVELDKSNIRLPYVTVGAAIAKAKSAENGTQGLGWVLADCYPEGKDSDPAKARLRRLLACSSIKEVCQILRSIFSLIHAKNKSHLVDFAQVLTDLQYFVWENARERIKSQWAQDFYAYVKPQNKTDSIKEAS